MGNMVCWGIWSTLNKMNNVNTQATLKPFLKLQYLYNIIFTYQHIWNVSDKIMILHALKESDLTIKNHVI